MNESMNGKDIRLQKRVMVALGILMFVLPVPQFVLTGKTEAVGCQGLFLCMCIPYLVYLSIQFFGKNGRKVNAIGFCVIGFLGMGLSSVFVASNKMLALLGSGYRAEGYLVYIVYVLLFFVTTQVTERRFRKGLFYLFLLFGIIVSVLGIIQFCIPEVWGNLFWGMACVPLQNPNFYGAFSVLFTGICIGGFLLYRNDSEISHPFPWWNRRVWFMTILLGYAACISALSSVIYVGLIMIFFFEGIRIFLGKNGRVWDLIWLILGLLSVMIVLNVIRDGAVWREFCTVGEQIKTEGSVLGDSVGSGRMMIWKKGLEILPKYWLFGCGIENLQGAFFEEYGLLNGMYCDRMHNEYYNLLMTEGIFSVVFYILFLLALSVPFVEQYIKRDVCNKRCSYEIDDVSGIVFYAFVGYISQAFFNISVIQVAPYFWIICGLLYSGRRSA